MLPSPLPKRETTHRYLFMGQRWRFLKKIGCDGTEIIDRHASVKKAIDDVEKYCLDQRILDVYDIDIEDATSPRRDASSHQNIPDAQRKAYGAHSTVINFPAVPVLEIPEATELQSSVKNLRMFYRERNMAQAADPAIYGKITESPRDPSSARKTNPFSPLSCENEGIFGVSPRPPITSKETSHRNTRNTTGRQLKSQLTKEIKTKTPSSSSAPSSIKKRTGPKQKQGFTAEERLCVTKEQLRAAEIGKSFKTFVEEKGYRLPHFLNGIDPTPEMSQNRKHENIRK